MAEARKTVTESDNLAGAVTTIQYKKSQNDAVSEVQSASVLTETIQDHTDNPYFGFSFFQRSRCWLHSLVLFAKSSLF